MSVRYARREEGAVEKVERRAREEMEASIRSEV